MKKIVYYVEKNLKQYYMEKSDNIALNVVQKVNTTLLLFYVDEQKK